MRRLWKSTQIGALSGLVAGVLLWIIVENHIGEPHLDPIGVFLLIFMLFAQLAYLTVGNWASPYAGVTVTILYIALAGALVGYIGGVFRNSHIRT